MKHVSVAVILFMLFAGVLRSQELTPQEGFSFTFRCKVKIKLDRSDISNIKYSVVSMEPYHKIIDTDSKDDLLPKKVDKDMVEFIFGLGTHGKTEKEKNENRRVLLILRSGTEQILEYKAEIKREKDGGFESTSVYPLFPGALCTEIWPYAIYEIALHSFSFNKN